MEFITDQPPPSKRNSGYTTVLVYIYGMFKDVVTRGRKRIRSNREPREVYQCSNNIAKKKTQMGKIRILVDKDGTIKHIPWETEIKIGERRGGVKKYVEKKSRECIRMEHSLLIDKKIEGQTCCTIYGLKKIRK